MVQINSFENTNDHKYQRNYFFNNYIFIICLMDNIDLSILEDFKITAEDDWINWQFKHEQYEHIPLSFYNRLSKWNVKYSDLSTIQHKAEESDFTEVLGNIRRKDKSHLSRYTKLTDRRPPSNIRNNRIFSKREQRNRRWYENANKTKFKQITVKSEWKQIQSINKTKLQEMSKKRQVKISHIKTIGRIFQLNPQVERISWRASPFRQNQAYEVKSASTDTDDFFTTIAGHLLTPEVAEKHQKVQVICSPEFLFALMTVPSSIYPWSMSIEKMGKVIILNNYHGTDDSEKITYLDLFTTNENTNNSMATDQAKVREFCMTSTKLVQVFQDLLVSGDEIQVEKKEENNQFENKQEEEEEQVDDDEEEKQKKQEPSKLIKYLKVSMSNMDIYTKVRIDGAKLTKDDELEYYLVRTFVETETQGGWLNLMKTSPGTIVTKEYQSNNCNLQKWLFEAKLAGVRKLKLGFIGIDKNRPILLNVNETSVETLEQTLSVKMEERWGIVNHIISKVAALEDGIYLLTKSAYTPLSLKLYMIEAAEDVIQEEQNQGEDEEEMTQK